MRDSQSLTYFLNFILIPFLDMLNFISSFLSLLNLLPRFDLFLLQQSNTISKQLCISLNPKYKQG